MSTAGPAITFSEKETQLFSQVYKKLHSNEWTPAKARAYFKNDEKLWAKFACFSQEMLKNSEAELAQKRAEFAQREAERQARIAQEKENLAQSKARVAESQARVAQSQARVEQIDSQKAVIFSQMRKIEGEIAQARSQTVEQVLQKSSRITVN